MTDRHATDRVRGYDLFKLIVAIILLILIFLRLFGTIAGGTTTAVPEPLGTPQTVQPTVAAIGGVLAAQPVLLSPAPGVDVVQSARPTTLSGLAAPNAAVQVVVDGAVAAATVADDSGAWSAPALLNQGLSTVAIQTVDPSGSVISQSAPVALSVRPPLPPTIDSPGDGLPFGGTVLRGTAEAGLPVAVLVDGTLVDTVFAGPDGRWELPVDLAIGPHEIVAQMLYDDGEVMGLSVPTAVAVRNPLSFTPVESGGLEFDPLTGLYTLTGMAIPGDTVQLLIDGEVLGTAEADVAGMWTMIIDPPVGESTVSLQTVDDGGAVLTQLDPFSFTVGSPPPHLAMPGLSLVDPATGVASPAIPAGAFTLQGQGVPNAQVQLTIDGQPAGSAAVDTSGAWSANIDLAPGSYQLEMATLDGAGQTLATTRPLSFTVVDSPRPVVNPPAAGWTAGTNTVSGVAAPGATVVVLVNGEPMGSTTAGPDSAWSLDVELGEGSSSIAAQTQDETGAPLLGSVPVVAPVGVSVVDAAAASDQFETLIQAIELAGLGETLAAGGPYTIFAPTDDAFAALPAATLEGLLADPAALAAVLQYHVVPGQYAAADLAGVGKLPTVAGQTLSISSQNGQVYIDNAAVAETDVPAANGIVHVINQVLLPLPAGVVRPVIDESGVATFTGAILTVVGDAQPGARIDLRLNGVPFGEVVTVGADGFWLVADDIRQGQYEIVAYLLDEAGALVAASRPVNLLVP